jgi:hypothetical protein
MSTAEPTETPTEVPTEVSSCCCTQGTEVPTAEPTETSSVLTEVPTAVSVSWLIQPKKMDNERYVFAKYYESSSFLHSANDLRLEFSLILRETRDNTMGYLIQCKNLEKGMSLSMHADFVMKKKDDACTFRSFHKTKTEYFVFNNINIGINNQVKKRQGMKHSKLRWFIKQKRFKAKKWAD